MDKDAATELLTRAADAYWPAEAEERARRRDLYQAIVDAGDELTLRAMSFVVGWSDEHIRQIQKDPEKYLSMVSRSPGPRQNAS